MNDVDAVRLARLRVKRAYERLVDARDFWDEDDDRYGTYSPSKHLDRIERAVRGMKESLALQALRVATDELFDPAKWDPEESAWSEELLDDARRRWPALVPTT